MCVDGRSSSGQIVHVLRVDYEDRTIHTQTHTPTNDVLDDNGCFKHGHIIVPQGLPFLVDTTYNGPAFHWIPLMLAAKKKEEEEEGLIRNPFFN